MTEPIDLIIAATGPHPGLAENLARFAAEAGPLGRVLVVTAAEAVSSTEHPSIRTIRSPRGRLAPELWRDGLIASGSPLVAFSTSPMRPEPGWLPALAGALRESGAAGVGGPIAPASVLPATDRAVALLRYSAYFPGADRGAGPPAFAPPGENALYRRDALIEVESSWADGFWEVEVQRALVARGHRLAMARSAVVEFAGGADLAPMVGQRFAHGRRYGRFRSRCEGLGRRLIRAASAPLVPPLLIARISRNLRSRELPIGPWLPALPALGVLATAWALGEACGAAGGPVPDGSAVATSKDRGFAPIQAHVHS